MSGVFGFFGKKFDEDSRKQSIDRMLPWNRIYGSGGEDVYLSNYISLGCCFQNLSGEHISKNAILNNQKYIAAIDVLIYNREELLEKIEPEKSPSDEELLLMYIEKFGISAIREVNGDFAGAIFDKEEHKLTLFRDHMGIRPFYYYYDNEITVFSTDLRGLIANSFVKTDLREEWIYGLVAGYDVESIDSTPYVNIKCVPPASYIEFTQADSGIAMNCAAYWKLGSGKVRMSSDEEYIVYMRELIKDAVEKRLNAVSGIVGAEMSGGLDSGVIDILINRSGREAVYFSWSLDPNELEMASDDERKVVGDICEQEKIQCNFSHMGVDFKDKAIERLKDTGIILSEDVSGDFLFAFPENVNTFTILKGSQFVNSMGASVMFTGHGGDEGVSRRASAYEMFYHKEFYHYWRYIWRITTTKPRVLRTLKRGFENIFDSMRENKQTYTAWYASPELLRQDFRAKYKRKKYNNLQFSYDAVGYIESGGSRNRLDNMALQGAYASVRYLIPYLDYRVIDYAVSIPRYLYTNERIKRYIFRQAFKDIMPQSLYKLRNKEDTSLKNLPENPNWFEEYDRRKKEIIDKLDRDYWGEYLDFSIINALYEKGEPLECEFDDDNRHLKALLKCALAKNLLDKAEE